ncbi:MAG: serine hydrolase [Candidatus Paceibacterota bacterium]|jgi:D-alanyl-D-alanine carboxypeptidase (penicillin-binding protein 5/6)
MDSINKNYFLFFITISILLEAIFFSIGNNKFNIEFIKKENEIIKIQNNLANIEIQAKAFSIYDQNSNKIVYGKNDDIKMPIASLTKIMTVIVALNGHSMNDIVEISKNSIGQEGDYGFLVNEKFKISDLAKFTLIGSANDGAYTLAESQNNFLEKMNEKAKKIGMENTQFLNFTGLDINENAVGSFSTAQDMNILAMYALKAYPEIFSASIMPEIKIKSENGIEHDIKNTNYILDKIPNILFSKTGFTPLAGGNLTIIYKNKYGHIIAITVLGSTQEGRFDDIEKIIETLYNVNYGK